MFYCEQLATIFPLLGLWHSWETPKYWSRKPLPCCYSNATHLHFPISHLFIMRFLTGENLFLPLSFPLYALISVVDFLCLLVSCGIKLWGDSVNQHTASSRTLILCFPLCLACMNTSYLSLMCSKKLHFSAWCEDHSTIHSAFSAVKLLWDCRHSATFRGDKIDPAWRSM